MNLLSGFLLGFFGSVHCAVMCGPLMLAIPRLGGGSAAGKAAYHAGRLFAYAALGVLAGLFGRSLALLGLQGWLSIAAGVAVVGIYFLGKRHRSAHGLQRFIGWLRARTVGVSGRSGLKTPFVFGAINGLLPCGLVYVAAGAAISAGNPLAGAGVMLAFGAGTLPLLLGVGWLKNRLTFRAPQLIPYAVMLVSSLLIVRGMGLGIPYLSPKVGVLPCH